MAAVAAVLAVMFLLNPAKTSYSMDFFILYPTSATEKYPDGAPFYYHDMISAESLNAAKASDEEFSSVDVMRMLKEDDISVSAESETVNGVRKYTGRYTVTVKGSYFKSARLAERFIRAIANVPVTRIKESAKAIDDTIDDDVFLQASFEERLQLLREQKEKLIAKYDAWIEIYTASYSVEGKTLANYRAEIAVIYGESTQKSLEETFETNGYNQLDLNSYETTQEAIDARVEQLNSEKTLNSKIIDALKEELGSASGQQSAAYSARALSAKEESASSEGSTVVISPSDPDLSQMLAYYVKRNTEIDYQLQNTLTVKKVESFAERLTAQCDALNKAAETLTRVTASIYGRDSSVSFETQNAVRQGGTSVAFAAVGVFILVFLIAAVIVYIVEMPKYKAQKARRDESGEEADREGTETEE